MRSNPRHIFIKLEHGLAPHASRLESRCTDRRKRRKGCDEDTIPSSLRAPYKAAAKMAGVADVDKTCFLDKPSTFSRASFDRDPARPLPRARESLRLGPRTDEEAPNNVPDRKRLEDYFSTLPSKFSEFFGHNNTRINTPDYLGSRLVKGTEDNQ